MKTEAVHTIAKVHTTISGEAVVGLVAAQVFAYICRDCDKTHLCVNMGDGNVVLMTLRDGDAENLSKMLINPPTEEGLKL